MKALRYHGRRDFRLEEIPEPTPRAGEVQIKVKYCGICGSDVHEYVAGLNAVPTVRPHPQTGKMAPIVGGHEFSGIISEVGAGPSGFAVGDRVVVRPTLPCYQCRYCRTGHQSQCLALATIGISADGAFSEYVIARQDCLVPLRESVTFESATYAEPLACAVHAVKRGSMRPGATVAVIGAGTIGLMAVQAALANGATAVHVYDPVSARRQMALRAGANAVHEPDARDPGKALAAATGGERADVVFECAGAAGAIALADSLAGRGGTVVSMGFPTEPVTLSLHGMFMREKALVFSIGYDNEDFETAASLIDTGRIKTDELLTSDRIRLADILAAGFGRLVGSTRLEHVKILVTPE